MVTMFLQPFFGMKINDNVLNKILLLLIDKTISIIARIQQFSSPKAESIFFKQLLY